MHVLICDDDRATRFAVKRILTQHLGCRTTECEDGVAALQLIAREKFSFVMLDVEMPLMTGIEALELLRESPDTHTLPVVILSNVRDERAVRQLLQLGVSDYVLKPPRTDKLVAKLQRLIKVLPHDTPGANGEARALRLSPTAPAMLVEGNLDHRFFFASQAQRYGTIQEIESGASAVARFKDSTARVVFVGSDLGVVNAAMLVRKLRATHRDRPLRIVGMLDATAPDSLRQIFDDVMPRTLLPDTFRAAIRPFVDIPGPLSAFSERVPDLITVACSAASQVFGMMFDAELHQGELGTEAAASACATIPIQVDERFAVTVGVHLDTASAGAVAVKMFGSDDVSDEDRASVAGELANLISGRIHANFRERGLPSRCGLPTAAPAGSVSAPSPTDGVLARFVIDGTGDFFVSAVVIDQGVTQATSAATPPPSEASTSPSNETDAAPAAPHPVAPAGAA